MHSTADSNRSRYSIIFPANTLSGVEILKLIQRETVAPLFNQVYLSFSGWDVAVDHATLELLNTNSANQLIQSNPALPSVAAIKGAELPLHKLADTVIIAGLPVLHLCDRIERSGRQCLLLGTALSALEELAELLGEPLNDWAMAVATYHREYIGGLTRLGIPYAHTATAQETLEPTPSYKALLRKELRLEGQIIESATTAPTYLSNQQLWNELEAQFAMAENSSVRKHDYADISFVLIPERYLPVLNSYITQLQCEEKNQSDKNEFSQVSNTHILFNSHVLLFYNKNIPTNYEQAQASNTPLMLNSHVLLFYNDECIEKQIGTENININHIVAVQFSGSHRFKNLIKELKANHNITALFNLAEEQGPHSVFLQAQCKRKNHVGEGVTQLVDNILAVAMVKSRPLKEYRTTFFLPFEFIDNTVQVNPDIHLYKYDFKQNNADSKDTDSNDKNPKTQKEFLLDNIENINERFEKSCYEYLDPSIRDLLIPRFTVEGDLPSVKKWNWLNKTKFRKPQSNGYHLDATLLKQLKEWRLDLSTPGYGTHRYEDFKNWRIEAKFGKPQRNGYHSDNTLLKCQAVVRNLRLYQYFNGLYLLGITLQSVVEQDENHLWFKASAEDLNGNDNKNSLNLINNESSIYNNTANWWHDLIFGSAAKYKRIEQCQSAYWLIITQLFRSILPGFKIDKKEEWHIGKENVEFSIFSIPQDKDFLILSNYYKESPKYKRNDIFPMVDFFLNQFFTEKNHDSELYPWHDDRMYVNAAYSMAGVIADADIKRDSFWKLFSYMLYVDSGGFEGMNDWAYDPNFLKNLMTDHVNQRWFANGVLAGFTDYSTVHAGFGYFFQSEAINHTQHQYEKMLILALFYQSSLRHYSRRLQIASSELVSSGNENLFTEMRQDFIWFTNVYWFHELTEQIQGKEMFAKQLAGLGLQKDYDLIKSELEWADDFLEMKKQSKFNVVAGILALIALTLETCQLIVSPEKAEWKDHFFVAKSIDAIGGNENFLLGIFTAVSISIIISVFYMLKKK